MSEGQIRPADRLLLTLHNFGIVNEKVGKTDNELVQIGGISVEQLRDILNTHETAGYLESITDRNGSKRYFLTGKGIIRVSSAFT